MDRKEEILSKTRQLVMKYGIKSVSMDDIARQLGISKKTIYQYVDNKQDLVRQIVQSDIEEEQCQVQDMLTAADNALDEIISIARLVLAQLRELPPNLVYDMKKYYPAEWQMMEQHHRTYVTTIIGNNIQRGITEGLYRSDVEASVIAILYHAMTHAIVDEDLFPLKKYSKSELYSHMIKYHLHGLVTDKGRAMVAHLDIDKT